MSGGGKLTAFTRWIANFPMAKQGPRAPRAYPGCVLLQTMLLPSWFRPFWMNTRL